MLSDEAKTFITELAEARARGKMRLGKSTLFWNSYVLLGEAQIRYNEGYKGEIDESGVAYGEGVATGPGGEVKGTFRS